MCSGIPPPGVLFTVDIVALILESPVEAVESCKAGGFGVGESYTFAGGSAGKIAKKPDGLVAKRVGSQYYSRGETRKTPSFEKPGRALSNLPRWLLSWRLWKAHPAPKTTSWSHNAREDRIRPPPSVTYGQPTDKVRHVDTSGSQAT